MSERSSQEIKKDIERVVASLTEHTEQYEEVLEEIRKLEEQRVRLYRLKIEETERKRRLMLELQEALQREAASVDMDAIKPFLDALKSNSRHKDIKQFQFEDLAFMFDRFRRQTGYVAPEVTQSETDSSSQVSSRDDRQGNGGFQLSFG